MLSGVIENGQWYKMGKYSRFLQMFLSCYYHFWIINDLSFLINVSTNTASRLSTFKSLNRPPGAWKKKGKFLNYVQNTLKGILHFGISLLV